MAHSVTGNNALCYRCTVRGVGDTNLQIVEDGMMRVNAEIRGFDVAGDIRFHGSHSEDEEVVSKIKELNDFLFDIFEQLEVVENQVKGRQEMSAIRIEREIKLTKELLLKTFFIEGDNQ